MTRILTILFAALFLFPGQALAEPPACTGTNLMAKLKAERPADYEAVLAEAKAVPNGTAVFWKIERDGVKPSFLLGTAHVTDRRITELKPEMQAAFDHADAVALEMKEIGSMEQAAMETMANAKFMVLPLGQSLWDLIPDADEALIRNNVNLVPGTIDTFFGYQPWVVATAISIPLCETMREQAGLMPLDMQLAAATRKKGIPLHGLETMAEQLSVMANMPMDQQITYLLAVARSGGEIADQFETLISLYDQRLITALMPLMTRIEPQDAANERVMAYIEQDLIIRRNRTMAARAAELLATGNVFIAVGALHLPGAEGLVELIRRAGYKVTPLN